jgi:hypothetical protein
MDIYLLNLNLPENLKFQTHYVITLGFAFVLILSHQKRTGLNMGDRASLQASSRSPNKEIFPK